MGVAMAAQSVAASERAALCALLDELGPDAPTLCAGWTTADLAAHLFVRERRPLSAVGIIVSPLSSMTDHAMERAKQHHSYSGLVDQVRKGPPFFWLPLDKGVNTMEYFIHHEDVRRAGAEWAPREDERLDGVLWGSLRRGARLLARGLKGAGLELVRPDGERVVARTATPRAIVTGGPQELALFLYGRGSATRVTIDGPDAARSALEAAKFSV